MTIPKDSRHRQHGFELKIHCCLGAPLERLEAEIALNSQVQRTPELKLAVPENASRWRKSLIVRGLERLPVTL